eukprot:m.81247 g.81247  ORF g.81247 m.81247 type:complete len:536 (+) comp20969_c0_seq3:140-1747(+)
MLLVLLLGLCGSSFALDVYASVTRGNDASTGTSPNAPVKTLSKAWEITHTDPSLSSSLFLDTSSTFYVNETLTLANHLALNITSWDPKGSSDGKPSSRATISGAYLLRNWTRQPDGTWEAVIPAAVGLFSNISTLFVDGNRREKARTSTLYWSRQLVPGHHQDENRFGFVYSEGDIDPQWNLSAAALKYWTVGGFHSWVKSYHTVTHIFPHNRTILFGEPAQFAYGDYVYCSKRRWYIEGIPELPLLPGQFRLTENKHGLVINYAPLPNEVNPNQHEIVLPSVSQLFVFRNATNVHVDNISFEYSSANCHGTACDSDLAGGLIPMIAVDASRNFSVTNSYFAHSNGGYVVHVEDSPNFSLSHCLMEDLGGGGVSFHSSNFTRVNNSYVVGYGKRFAAAVGVSFSTSPNSSISFMEITGGWYNGIAGGTSAFSHISHNHVHNNGHVDDSGICDFGAIHIGNTGETLPLFVHDNNFHNISAYQNGGAGIYIDVSSTAVQVLYIVLPLPISLPPYSLDPHILPFSLSPAFSLRSRTTM